MAWSCSCQHRPAALHSSPVPMRPPAAARRPLQQAVVRQSPCAASAQCSSAGFRGTQLRWRGSTGTTGQRQPAARLVTRMMANTAESGIFSPIVVVVKKALGQKQFNQVRGKAISLHSQVIKEFCKNIGADAKQIQGLIRLAKQNGGKLGFLS